MFYHILPWSLLSNDCSATTLFLFCSLHVFSHTLELLCPLLPHCTSFHCLQNKLFPGSHPDSSQPEIAAQATPVPNVSLPSPPHLYILLLQHFWCSLDQITGPSAFFPHPQNHRTAPQFPPTAGSWPGTQMCCNPFCVTGTVCLPGASQINALPMESALQLLAPGSAIKQSHIQQLIVRNNAGNLYLRPLWPIYFGHSHFADPKVLQQWKNRQLKFHFLRKQESTQSPPISIFQSFFEWAVYPGKPWPFYLLCRSRYPDHQTSQSLM